MKSSNSVSKVKTYLLIVVVLSIWGIVIAKIIDAIQPNETLTKSKQESIVAQSINLFDIKKPKDLIIDYQRDPFLGDIIKKTPTPTTKLPTKSSGKKPTVFPNIKYLGSISSNKLQQDLFIIESNGIQYTIKEKQKIDSLLLQKGTTNYIIVLMHGKSHKIEKIN